MNKILEYFSELDLMTAEGFDDADSKSVFTISWVNSNVCHVFDIFLFNYTSSSHQIGVFSPK